MQTMPDFRTFNFFIGANNAGKSTVLNFISRHLPPPRASAFAQEPTSEIDPLEIHSDGKRKQITMAFGHTLSEALLDLEMKNSDALKEGDVKSHLIEVLKALGHKGIIWRSTSLPYSHELRIVEPNSKALEAILDQYQWQRLWSALTKHTGGGLRQHWIPETVKYIAGALDEVLPKVRLIPAIRQVGPKGAAFEDFSGMGLVDQLAAIQNPEHDKRSEREKFDRINGFLRSVTGKNDAEIEIPYSRDHILVHMDGRVLPLSSLGTGIHEVIMIAAFCTIAEREIVCVEEPELHLHPLLQRKLISYLAANTENQYFIATHSASFIDTPGAAIFHVSLRNGTTQIKEAILKGDRYAICVDLGHRASDIVQANVVIWVEGPSDRIYLNHWISTADPELIEGIHYSIMFYGGRLLSHLSADDEELSEFIQLRSLNRNIAIVMDSDKASAQAKINATKNRVRNEFDRHGGVAWVTKGREIENYIDHARLHRAIKKIYGATYQSPVSPSPYDHALHFNRTGPKRVRKSNDIADPVQKDVDKVKVAKAVAADGLRDLDILDLKERIEAVVSLIRKANE